ncbi:hypothetical protein PLA106_02860, partial [Pseudomonas amygdali pv. lachrymans str. M302278]
TAQMEAIQAALRPAAQMEAMQTVLNPKVGIVVN